MAATERRMGLSTKLFPLFLGLFLNSNLVVSFNMDLKSPIIFRSSNPNTYFGYSMAFHKAAGNSLFVGAPKETQNGKQYGGIYQCKIKRVSNEICDLYTKKDKQVNPNSNYIEDGQWMGATVFSDTERLLTCAPRFVKKESGEELMIGKCDYTNPSIDTSIGDTVFNPCDSVSDRLSAARSCQVGISGNIAGDASKTIYSGAPGIRLSTGNIAIRFNAVSKFSPTTGLNMSDYMGYSVTSGRFKKDKGILLVGGAPRGNDLGGKVMFYDSADPGYKVFSSINDPSSINEPRQTGSYFGSSLAAADINGDGFSDLVVGAPQFANPKPNQGAVYIYMNDKDNGLILSKQVLHGEKEDGFFGFALGSVGDLNDDGMQEIAVGAPWAGKDGKGLVHLYYGTKNKDLPLVLKQVITPADVNNGANFDGFGFSFAEYYPYSTKSEINNLDGKGYNDLAVGAYRSGHVAVLRSRPVVTIVGTLSLGGTNRIDLFNSDPKTMCDFKGKKFKCIKNVEACFQIPGSLSGASDTLKYKIDLDSEQVVAKRGFFDDGKGNEVNEWTSTLTGVNNTEKCAEKMTIYLKNNTKDVLRAFAIEMSWDYQEEACNAGDICPIANAMLDLTSFKKIPYVKGCSDDGNDECNSDLAVTIEAKIPGGGKSIAIGVTKTVTITVDIKNNRENAFINVLELIYPNVVSPNKVTIVNFPGTVEWDPNVSADSQVLTLRVKLSSPIKQKSTEQVNVVFSVLDVAQGDKVSFIAEAKTDSKEMKPDDNKAEVTLSVSLSADLTVSGRAKPEQLKWDKENKDPKRTGPQITHTFFFQNMGPSTAEESDVEVKIPEKIDNDYVLNIYDVQLTPGVGVFGTIGSCDVKKADLNPLKLDLSNRTFAALTSKRKRREAPTARHDCSVDGSCRIIKCKLTKLSKSQSATLTVFSTLVEATFDKLKESRQLVASAKFSSTKVERPNNADPDTVDVVLSVNSPYFTIEKEGGGIAWWIILLCILGAVIIIVIIVFILYKKGFFKRKKHGEEEEEEEGLRKGDPDDDY